MDKWCYSENVAYQTSLFSMEHKSEEDRVYIGIFTGNWKQDDIFINNFYQYPPCLINSQTLNTG